MTGTHSAKNDVSPLIRDHKVDSIGEHGQCQTTAMTTFVFYCRDSSCSTTYSSRLYYKPYIAKHTLFSHCSIKHAGCAAFAKLAPSSLQFYACPPRTYTEGSAATAWLVFGNCTQKNVKSTPLCRPQLFDSRLIDVVCLSYVRHLRMQCK